MISVSRTFVGHLPMSNCYFTDCYMTSQEIFNASSWRIAKKSLQGMHPKMQVNFLSAPRQGEIIFCLGEVCRLKIHVNKNFSWPSTSFTELWKLARNSFKVNYYFWYAPQNVGLPFSNFLLNKFITSNMLPHVRCWIN